MHTQYPTTHVQGDTPTPVQDVKAGDTIRLYVGIVDTATVTAVTRDIRQGAHYVYRVATDVWPAFELRKGDTVELATGGPRVAL